MTARTVLQDAFSHWGDEPFRAYFERTTKARFKLILWFAIIIITLSMMIGFIAAMTT